MRLVVKFFSKLLLLLLLMWLLLLQWLPFIWFLRGEQPGRQRSRCLDLIRSNDQVATDHLACLPAACPVDLRACLLLFCLLPAACAQHAKHAQHPQGDHTWPRLAKAGQGRPRLARAINLPFARLTNRAAFLVCQNVWSANCAINRGIRCCQRPLNQQLATRRASSCEQGGIPAGSATAICLPHGQLRQEGWVGERERGDRGECTINNEALQRHVTIEVK